MWKNWFQEQLRPKKKAPSLEQLKYHYAVLSRTSQVTDGNRALIVETFRAIAEILIWGDQNDNSVFDFFLEKNMQSFFLRILSQRCGKFVCVQLLQTLNILYENIRNETSLYYLLSNNHINSIIVHKFDFSDEEILAYYISFLKTLSFKLNMHTIHFFYNEHLRDFPLYTEAIKFFNHHESMVRIAVRTLTLNVYKVNDSTMLEYIRNKTAAPYFSNLVWFIGSNVIELDECIRCQADHLNRSRLEHLVAEHLDHMHYLNDILSLGVESLNDVLITHTLGRLLLPLYVYSITNPSTDKDKKLYISSMVALFLLSQVFLIIQSPSLVTKLAHVILSGQLPQGIEESIDDKTSDSHAFVPPDVNLETKFRQPPAKGYIPAQRTMNTQRRYVTPVNIQVGNDTKEEYLLIGTIESNRSLDNLQQGSHDLKQGSDDLQKASHDLQNGILEGSHDPRMHEDKSLSTKREVVAMETILEELAISNDDRSCLFTICLLDGIISNKGVDRTLLKECHLLPNVTYHHLLVTKLFHVLETSTKPNNYVRLVTMAMCMKLLQEIMDFSKEVILIDEHLAQLEDLLECSKLFLRLHYQGAHNEIFLELFEDEYWMHQNSVLKPSLILMDVAVLLLPTETPLTGIEFTRRLPCGKHEKTRRALRVFFAVRQLYHKLTKQVDGQMPLTPPTNSASCGDLVDLNNYDMLPCTVTIGHRSMRRFLVLTDIEILLVEPGRHHLGCGVIHFIGFLQSTDISADPADSCAIFITVHNSCKKLPSLSAHCRFDDHIRCVSAKKNISHKRESLRLAKMTSICYMLDIPDRPMGGEYGVTKGAAHYTKLTVVNDKSSVSHDHITSSHTTTLPSIDKEAIQLTNKNDDGSLMLPFRDVEMAQLGNFTLSPRSPEQQQLNMFLDGSSFSHEDLHLDQQQQHHDTFDQRQSTIYQQRTTEQFTTTSDQRQDIHLVTDQTAL